MLEQAWQLYITGKHKMGRYISTGTTQTGTNTCSTIINSTCYQVNGHKYSFDSNSCWQNRIIVDTPGSYTFTVPAGVTCIRTIAVGGGGKVKGCSPTCCGFAGAGGGYVERTDTVAAGCTVTIVVGRQEQDTTIAYTNSSAVARTLTAGGAAGCTPGTATGGDWNSTGGQAGYNYSNGISCGRCVYVTTMTCCGYCLVYSGISGRTIDPNHAQGCCFPMFAGGGSAGSWIWPTGGSGQCTIGQNQICQGDSYGPVAGGGGGIGYINRDWQGNWNCACVCVKNQCGIGYPFRRSCFPASAGGGGGTKFQCTTCFEFWSSDGYCEYGTWRMGEGGWGGRNNDEGRSEWLHWWCSNNQACMGRSNYFDQGPSPRRYPWHDIHEMAGSGSPGQGFHFVCYQSDEGNMWNVGHRYHPYNCVNAGEGAGTGGVVYNCCEMSSMGMSCCVGGADAFTGINMQLVCCLGTTNRVCCADKMLDQLFPYVTHCAGTLGGSGGVGTCNLASRAGKGGGAGIPRNYLLCVCWGGSFNLCNGSGPALAFPPCDLDWRASMAGTGMAIVYWRNP
jgi:hypothetical protein